MTIGEKIKKARKEQHMSQEMLAEKLGVTVQAVSKWECGVNYPDILNLPQIADYLNISLDELLRGDYDTDEESFTRGIPDDGKLRVFAAVGRKLILRNSADETIKMSDILIRLGDADALFEGKPVELHVMGNADIIGAVGGSVNAGNNATVEGCVSGSINAGNNVKAEGNVDGSINAGNNVTVGGDAAGNVIAGNDIKFS